MRQLASSAESSGSGAWCSQMVASFSLPFQRRMTDSAGKDIAGPYVIKPSQNAGRKEHELEGRTSTELV